MAPTCWPGGATPMPGTGRLPDWTNNRVVRFAPTYVENERLLAWLRASPDLTDQMCPCSCCWLFLTDPTDPRPSACLELDQAPRPRSPSSSRGCRSWTAITTSGTCAAKVTMTRTWARAARSSTAVSTFCVCFINFKGPRGARRGPLGGDGARGRSHGVPSSRCFGVFLTAFTERHPAIMSIAVEECLEDMCDGHNVTHTVFLQATAGGQYPNWNAATALPESLRPLIEVELCQGIAAKCDAEKPGAPRICAGIMGWADFQDPHVEDLLIADCKLRNFRGVRGPAPDAADANFCL